MTLLSVTGCSSESKADDVNTVGQNETEIEETQVENETVEVEDESSTQEDIVVTDEVEQQQQPVDRMVEVDEDILNLGDYTYLTLYLNQSREAVLHDFGEPTQSKSTDDILIYDDFGFIMDGDNVMNVSVANGEMVGVKTDMTEAELIKVLGAPHKVTESGVGEIYWYIDKDKAITVSFENDLVKMVGYGNYHNTEAQENTSVDIGEYIYMTDKGLVLRTMYVEDKYIIGIIENISQDVRKMIDLEVAFYDANGNKISHDWDYLSELAPYETWKYKIRLDDNGTQYKFISLESE
jgi:hypothetical protein